jgi:uncharacterized protein (DUF2147 family)
MNAETRYRLRMMLASVLAAASLALHAESATVRGYWLEPSGSMLRIEPCADKLCVDIVALSRGDHPDTDVHNPDARLRARPLCGLRIGTDFVERDAQHADGGRLYDPKSGHTYGGSMSAEGEMLKLRGFIGVKLFGRTETWTRARQAPTACRGA